MDDPELDRSHHRAALAGLRRINRVSGTCRIMWSAIEQVWMDSGAGALDVLDVGCGGGDLVAGLAVRASGKRRIRFSGCDLSPAALEIASGRTAANGMPGIRFFAHDVMRDDLPDTYDVVMCSLFLHHCDDMSARILMRRMASASRRLVLIDDLCRTRVGYLLAWTGCRILSRSPVVRHDGPVSVARAFTPAEARCVAEMAGLDRIEVRRHWPERFLLTARPG